jgi:excinuclease ABC subunit C
MTSVTGSLGRLPGGPGVYRFRDGAGRVLYLGRASDLRRRVGSYWRDLGDRPHLARMVERVARIEAVACDSMPEATWLERNLHEAAMPPWNRVAGGAEVPVYIGLHDGPRSPGLRVVHTVHTGQPAGGGRLFGPYLGGAKVRLAVSALRRILPLEYAGQRLAGAQRDMARIRGVAPTGRVELVRAVAAVLEREPEAVASLRGELTRRRDAAAAGLAFELAARLQAEIAAIDWVVAEQKVTLSTPDSFDVHGWAGGMLVSFEMRDGRVSRWTQRVCGQAAARSRVDATPSAWTTFARRNAELAARLAGLA